MDRARYTEFMTLPSTRLYVDETTAPVLDPGRGKTKTGSYTKPIKTLAPRANHRAHKGLNNVIEVSHRSTRKQEKIFGRFKSHRQAHRFLSAHDQINLIFPPRRYQLTATSYRHARNDAFSLWAKHTTEMAA